MGGELGVSGCLGRLRPCTEVSRCGAHIGSRLPFRGVLFPGI